MALQLSIESIVQSNDGTTLTITDGTGVYDVSTNPTGWGTPNTQLSEIYPSYNALTLQVTVTTSDGIVTEYDPIDFYSIDFSTPTTVSDLVFEINPSMLISNGTTMGEATDVLVDGWYDLTYSVTYDLAGGMGNSNSYVTYKVVAGKVRSRIYDYFLVLPYHTLLSIPSKLYLNNTQELIYPIYLVSLYEGMHYNVTESKKNEILSQLELLEDLTLV